MKLESFLTVSIDVLMKSGKIINIRTKNKILDLDTEGKEYEALCDRYISEIGYYRNDSKECFDKDLLALLSEKSKTCMKEGIDRVLDTYKKYTLGGAVGSIELLGWIFDMREISGIHVIEYRIEMKGEQ